MYTKNDGDGLAEDPADGSADCDGWIVGPAELLLGGGAVAPSDAAAGTDGDKDGVCAGPGAHAVSATAAARRMAETVGRAGMAGSVTSSGRRR